jgi:16S rRNA (guanine966-N2)-methyltransferase
MRVIAGRFGGRRLKAPRGRATRPTSDRVREALFSMLGDLEGAVVLDLFAGTGALGIEEREQAALAVLGSNLQTLGLGEEQAEVRGGEALGALRAARARGETYDLVFVDPPYGRARELGDAVAVELPGLLEPGGRVVVESSRRSPVALPLTVVGQRTYGDTTITIHRQPERER